MINIKRNIEGNEIHRSDFTIQRKIRNQGKNLNYPWILRGGWRMGFPPKLVGWPVHGCGGRMSVWLVHFDCFFIILKIWLKIWYLASWYLGNVYKTDLSLTLMITASSQWHKTDKKLEMVKGNKLYAIKE